MVMLIAPAASPVHNPFIPGEHRGEDRGHGGGYDFWAAAPGVVEELYGGGGYNGGWGNRFGIRHTPRAVTTYNHWQTGSARVDLGQSVDAGTRLALMGSTGLAYGDHLHFELYIDGVRVDPAPYYTQDLPGSDGSGSGGVPAPGEWVVGTTLYKGATGDIALDAGALVYAAGPGDSEYGIAEAHGLTWEQLKMLTEKLGASKWAGQILAEQQSIHVFGQTVYQGHIFALNDVVAILDANEAAQQAAQQAAVAAAIVPVPAIATPGNTNRGVFLEPTPEAVVEEVVPGEVTEVDGTPIPPAEDGVVVLNRLTRPLETAPDTTSIVDIVKTAASNIVLPAWVRTFILWPLVIVWGAGVIALGQWYQGIGELPPAWYGGVVNVTIVLLPLVAVIAAANVGKAAPPAVLSAEAKVVRRGKRAARKAEKRLAK